MSAEMGSSASGSGLVFCCWRLLPVSARQFLRLPSPVSLRVGDSGRSVTMLCVALLVSPSIAVESAKCPVRPSTGVVACFWVQYVDGRFHLESNVKVSQ